MSSVRPSFPLVQRFFRPQLGDGETFRFWDDDWSGYDRLRRVFPRLYALSTDLGVSVRRVWLDTWILTLAAALSDQRTTEILSLQGLLADRHLSEAAHNVWVWSSPRFTAWAAYRLFRDQEDSEDPLLLQRCRLVWQRHLPLKIKVFA